jgi:hypothetical protein
LRASAAFTEETQKVVHNKANASNALMIFMSCSRLKVFCR